MIDKDTSNNIVYLVSKLGTPLIACLCMAYLMYVLGGMITNRIIIKFDENNNNIKTLTKEVIDMKLKIATMEVKIDDTKDDMDDLKTFVYNKERKKGGK